MPRASSSLKPSAATPATAAKNVRTNTGHSEPSCSTSAHKPAFRPVTRSMTRIPVASTDVKGIAITSGSHKSTPDTSFSIQSTASQPVVKEGVASTSSRRSSPDTCFSVQSAASQPIVTRVRTPHGVTKSAWKPLTQPVVLGEDLKRTSTPTTNATSKRSRVASSQAATGSASKANRNVYRGKKKKLEECINQCDQLDGTVISSPAKKLQSGKSSSDVVSKRKSTSRSQGELAAPLLMDKPQTETGKNSVSVVAEVASASTNDVSQPVVPLPAQQLQLESAKNSDVSIEAITSGTSQVVQSVAPVITGAIRNRTSLANPLVAPVSTLPRQHLQADNQKKFAKTIMTTSQASGPAGATGQLIAPKLQIRNVPISAASPLVAPKLHIGNVPAGAAGSLARPDLPIGNAPTGEAGPSATPKLLIGNMKDSSNFRSDPAYQRALLIKHQEQMLQQYKMQASQQHVHIRGPGKYYLN